jgi:hypothetical protein
LVNLIGNDLYCYANAAIFDGQIAVPLGLAPSYDMFATTCTNSGCGTPKYIRSFCLKCGQMHCVQNEIVYVSLKGKYSKRKQRQPLSSNQHNDQLTKEEERRSSAVSLPALETNCGMQNIKLLLSQVETPYDCIEYKEADADDFHYFVDAATHIGSSQQRRPTSNENIQIKQEKYTDSQALISEQCEVNDSGNALVEVKQEWPSQCMDKYQMATMRGRVLLSIFCSPFRHFSCCNFFPQTMLNVCF